MLVALAALFVALGGAGYAATGGTFVLGGSNTADEPSSLTARTPRAVLRLENESSAGNATALRLRVRKGHAPLRVNSAARVPNLNADRLDGLHASSFVRRGEVRTFGPVRLGDAETARVVRIGPFTFRGNCYDEGDYANGSLTVKSTEAHSAFVATDADGNLREASDMVRNQYYVVLSFQADPVPDRREFQAVSGMVAAPSGYAVDFDFYLAIYTLGAVLKPCVYGGAAIVASPAR